MSRFFSLLGLVVVGIVIADIVKNPTGTKAASSGIRNIEVPATNALLGATS